MLVSIDSRESAGYGGRLTDLISLGVLADLLPRELIEEVLLATGRREQRSRLLPAHVTVRFCLAMCLFYEDDYEEVIRKLVGSLRGMQSWGDSWHVPSSAAISKARARLGPEPLRELFDQVTAPVAGRTTKGAWLRDRRLVAVDGFMLDAPETDENIARFNFPHDPGNAKCPYPQVRVVGLNECGSHATFDAAIAGCRTGEKTLLPQLFRSFEPDMLVLADANFYGYTLWQQARQTGADLLWRISMGIKLPVAVELPDGSYLSIVFPKSFRGNQRQKLLDVVSAGGAVHPSQGVVVRVIEYVVSNRPTDGGSDKIRLITTVLDPRDIPAIELAAAYHERWEHETSIDELKTHQRGAGRVLRSKTADGVEQEIWALMLTHYAIRELMCRAADEADVDPDRLSFLHSLRVVRRNVTSPADFPP